MFKCLKSKIEQELNFEDYQIWWKKAINVAVTHIQNKSYLITHIQKILDIVKSEL